MRIPCRSIILSSEALTNNTSRDNGFTDVASCVRMTMTDHVTMVSLKTRFQTLRFDLFGAGSSDEAETLKYRGLTGKRRRIPDGRRSRVQLAVSLFPSSPATWARKRSDPPHNSTARKTTGEDGAASGANGTEGTADGWRRWRAGELAGG